MSWTSTAELRAQVQRRWDRGDLLRESVTPTLDWPLQLRLKRPGAADLSERFEAVRDWVRAIVATPQVRIEWREWTHRVLGRQQIPESIWLDSLDAALVFIGQTRTVQRFRALWERTAVKQPALLAWLSRRPQQALQLEDRWEALLAVVAWLQAHPRPAVYLRQVDAPGVDSKFIETHRSVLTEWLDLALPADTIDATASGVAGFARRFGFLDKPVRIRFRLLDSELPSLPGCRGQPDITLDAASFAMLRLPTVRVFITENETNFLAFPPVRHAIVIFGAGYGWSALAHADWLQQCDVRYWGDIDTHGFAILDQLRCHLPQAASFLMDRETLLAHRDHWGEEADPVRHDLVRLTPEEAVLYDELRCDRIRSRLRLEQERIGFGWLRKHLP